MVTQQCVERPEALEVEIGVHAAEGVHPHVAGGVDALNRMRPRVVDGKEPLGVLRHHATRGGVGPKTVLPVGIVAQPAPRPVSKLAGNVAILPRLVEYSWDPHAPHSVPPATGRFGLAGRMSHLSATAKDPDRARQGIVVQGALKRCGAAMNELRRGSAIEVAAMMGQGECVAAMVAIDVQVADAARRAIAAPPRASTSAISSPRRADGPSSG